MNLLITGGCGYIGHSLLEKIAELNGELGQIKIYDNLSRKNNAFFFEEKFKDIPIEFIQADILDNRKLKESIKGIDIVVHLAARVTTPYADYGEHDFEQVNHWGTACVVDAVEASDSVQKLIYLSSASVYGNQTEPATEETIPTPNSFYGVTKHRGEMQIQRLTDQRSWKIIRAGNVFGFNPSMRLDAVINKFMFEAHHVGRLTINGDGEQSRAYIHIDNLVKEIMRVISSPIENKILNAVERNLTINQVADQINVLYPEMERIYLNQHMPMKTVNIKENSAFTGNFQNQLSEIKNQFSV